MLKLDYDIIDAVLDNNSKTMRKLLWTGEDPPHNRWLWNERFRSRNL